MKTTKEGLQAVRKLITNPQNWTQGVAARNRQGYNVLPSSPDAFSFCLIGACRTITNTPLRLNVISKIYQKVPTIAITGFNDSSTHEQVLALLDGLIEKEE